MTHFARFSFALAAVAMLACGGSEEAAAGTESAISSEPTDSSTATSSDPATPVSFSEADLDAYERGMAAEIELVKSAQARYSSAKTPAERSAAMQAQWEEQSAPAAAKAAGIDEARYRATRDAVHGVLQTLDFQGKIDGPMSIDLERASEDMKARLARDAYDTLTPEAANALRARLDRLAKQWGEYVNLTAVAG